MGQGGRLGGAGGDDSSEGHSGPEHGLSTLFMSSHCLLAYMAFNEKLTVNLIEDLLNVNNFILLLSQLSLCL